MYIFNVKDNTWISKVEIIFSRFLSITSLNLVDYAVIETVNTFRTKDFGKKSVNRLRKG